jgi:hypothetical protein
MTAFKEFAIGKFVLRFYKTDHVWTCTMTEDMLNEVKSELLLQRLSDIGQEIEQEPVAWIDPKELDMDVSTSVTKNKTFDKDIPLYTKPQKYCPSENNEAYEKGFIDGMAKQRDSRVQQMVEGYTHPVKEQDVIRYQWLRNEFAHGRETYLAEGMPSGESLNKYIDEQLQKASEK